MIFVTVGTHEQPFNRLVKKMDEMKRDGILQEEVIIQIGFSTYYPQYCEYKKLIPWDEMQRYYREARIIITHGGPASFIDALQLGKSPIVVPRQQKFNEHVNNHQLNFAHQLVKKGLPLIVVDDVDDLPEIIRDFETKVFDFTSNNGNFNELLIKEIEEDLA